MTELPSFSLLSCFPYEKGKPREGQIFALKEIETKIRAGTKVIFVQGPTGTGKTFVAVALQRWLGSTYICTSNKALQKQYLEEFPELCQAKGRTNFKCLTDPKYSCNEGTCQQSSSYSCKRACSQKNDGDFAAQSARRGKLSWHDEGKDLEKCEYWKSKTNALNAGGTVHNYKYILTESFFVGDFGKRTLMISDEGHNVEKEIMGFMELKIVAKNLQVIKEYNNEEIITFETTPRKATLSEKTLIHIEWLEKLVEKIEKARETIGLWEDEETEAYNLCKNDEDRKAVRNSQIKLVNDGKELDKIQKKALRILEYFKNDPNNWIVQEKITESGLTESIGFKPVFINEYASELYFRLADVNIIMSATILNYHKMAASLGFEEAGYVEIPPCIPDENNRVFKLNLCKMSYSKLDTKLDVEKLYRDIAEKIDYVLQMHNDEKGIIHPVTSELAKNIHKYSKFSNRILVHDGKPGSREAVIELHKNSTEAMVLCSPAMTEGVDLKDDLSRFQIFVKIPYLNLDDTQVKRRLELDPEWYTFQAIIAITQGIGRSVRHEKDHCTTYIFDENIERIQRNPEMKAFNRHVRSITELTGIFSDELKRKIQRPNLLKNSTWNKKRQTYSSRKGLLPQVKAA